MKLLVLAMVVMMAIGCATAPPVETTDRVPEIEVADQALASGDYRGAVENYTLWLEKYPQDAEAFFGRGRSYNKLGEHPAALKDFEEAYRCYPKNLSPEVYRCGVLHAMGKDAAARSGLEALRAHDLFPKLGIYEQFLFHFLDGKLKNAAGTYKAALPPLNEAIRIADLNPDIFAHRNSPYIKRLALYQRFRSYFYLVEHGKMVRDLREYIALTTQMGQPSIDDYKALALAYYLTSQRDQCRQVLGHLSAADRVALGEIVQDVHFFAQP